MKPMPPKRRRKLIKILICSATILLLLVIAGPPIRDWAIRKSIEKSTSLLLGVPVTVGDFSLSLLTGKATIKDFKIANPPGFHEPEAFRFHEITLDLDMSTLLSDEIVVETLLVDSLSLNYELRLDGSSNLGQLQKNVEHFLNLDQTAAQTKQQQEESEEQKDAAGKRLVIQKLTINTADFKLTLLKTTAALSLPNLEMTDVGKGQNLAETLDDLLSQTIELSGKALDQCGLSLKNLQKTGEVLSDSVKDSGKKLQNSLKKIFQ